MWLQHLLEEQKVQRKPLQQDATRIKVTLKGVPRKYRSFVGNYVFCFCGQGEYGEMIACDSHIQYVQWSGSSSTVWGCLVLQRVNDFDKRCPFNGYLC